MIAKRTKIFLFNKSGYANDFLFKRRICNQQQGIPVYADIWLKDIGSDMFPANEHYFGLVNVSKYLTLHGFTK